MLKNVVVVAASLMLVTTSGCAPLRIRVTSFTSFGEANPNADKALLERYEAQEHSAETSTDVKVLVDTVPEGLQIKDGTISVEKGSPHQLVAKFALGNRGQFFPDFRDGWRKGLCYPQYPLFAATLAIWSVVPTFWPCFVRNGMTRDELISAAKSLALTAGANLVLLSYLGSTTEDVIGGGIGYLVNTDLRQFDRSKAKSSEPMATLVFERAVSPRSPSDGCTR